MWLSGSLNRIISPLRLIISIFRFDACQSPQPSSKFTFHFICSLADNLQQIITSSHLNIASKRVVNSAKFSRRSRISLFFVLECCSTTLCNECHEQCEAKKGAIGNMLRCFFFHKLQAASQYEEHFNVIGCAPCRLSTALLRLFPVNFLSSLVQEPSVNKRVISQCVYFNAALITMKKLFLKNFYFPYQSTNRVSQMPETMFLFTSKRKLVLEGCRVVARDGIIIMIKWLAVL